MTALDHDYSHTGAPTTPDLRHEYWEEGRRDIIDAPAFLPCGYHFNAKPSEYTRGGPVAAHGFRPFAYSSPKDSACN